MKSISLVMAYYDNPLMLSRQMADLAALPPEMQECIELVVVDDGSPRWPAHLGPVGMSSLQIYRIRKDVRWNQDAARNIGVRHAQHNWLLLTDIDHRVPIETWDKLINREHEPYRVYQFRRVSEPDMVPYKHHPNTWFMTRKMFDRIGGYDERFAGLYGTDSEFRERVRAEVGEISTIKEPIIRVPRSVTADASTTTYLRKQPEDGAGMARVKAERANIPDWKPLHGTFEYDRVFP